LSVRRDGSFVEFLVKDNGIGIAPGSQAKLFNLFSRLQTTDDRTPGGLGIGLALVRKLVEMHSGEVDVRSAGVGQGSEFVVRIPLLDSLPAAAVLAARGNAAAQARHRILVADDNPDALESLALLLECDGHEVWKAANGAEAFALAEKYQPHLALLDIGMPVLDGYEAARRIRSAAWGKGMMLVALSGWGQSSDVQRSRESGFDSHLVKPASFDALAQLLSRVPATTGGK
jgi:CheY-like chemotaxis protein